MPYFRKKPLIIQAVRFTGTNIDEVWAAFGAGKIYGYGGQGETYEALLIASPEGELRAEPGDWVVKGVRGELYPIKDEDLGLFYDPLSESSSGADRP